MSNRNKKIRILVVGDDEVGKTSFIASLISNSLKKVEKIIGPVVLPPDMFNWHYDCTTVLIDTSSDLSDIDIVENEVKQADVVLLMYDVTRISTAERLGIYWMPRIQRVSPKVQFYYNQIPVVVVGNKIDLQEDEKMNDEIEFQRIFKVIKPLIRSFNQVEMGMECSVKQGKSVSDIIHCAQRAFLFPLAPLYNLTEKQLTLNFKKALTRIFRLCDKDQDGRWNDRELMAFQQRVFKRELDQSDINGIKEMIKEELKDNSNDNGITLDGFLALQKRGVELIKIQTCWTILRYFKYQDDLLLEQNLFNNQLLIDQDAGQGVELSHKALDYVRIIFKHYLRMDPHLPVSRINEIFFPAERVPWKNLIQMVKSKHINNEYYIDLEQWLSLWQQFHSLFLISFLVYFDYMEAFKLLKYIGFDGALNESFIITNKKNSYSEYQKISTRNVFHILLITSPQSDQSQIIQSLIGYNDDNNIISNPIVITTSVQQKTRYLIISFCQENNLQQMINSQNYSQIDFIAVFNCAHFKPHPYPTIMIPDNSDAIKSQIAMLVERPLKYLDPVFIDELKSQDKLLTRFGGLLVVVSGFIASLTVGYVLFAKGRIPYQKIKKH